MQTVGTQANVSPAVVLVLKGGAVQHAELATNPVEYNAIMALAGISFPAGLVESLFIRDEQGHWIMTQATMPQGGIVVIVHLTSQAVPEGTAPKLNQWFNK